MSQLGIDTDTVEWPRAFQEICGKYGVNAIDLEHFQLLLDDRPALRIDRHSEDAQRVPSFKRFFSGSEVTYCEPESLHSILARYRACCDARA